MSISFEQFLAEKAIAHHAQGISIAPEDLNSRLFDFQKTIVSRSLNLGRNAIFADTGLGKSGMEWVWSDCVAQETGKPSLILTPLAVSKQMVRESPLFNIPLKVIESQSDVDSRDRVVVTNYEKLHKLDPKAFGAICIDEGSVLKNFSGKISQALLEFAKDIPFRLSATATPAPNDYEEFGMQSEFLGVMSRAEMLASFFRHDGGNTSDWKLMHYAEDAFWRWMASWAIVCRKPSDVGSDFDDVPYQLPALNEVWHMVDGDLSPDEGQIVKVMSGMGDRRKARKASLEDRCDKAIEIVNSSDEPWIVWCELNPEGDYLAARITDCKQVAGKDKDAVKESTLMGFSDREFRVLVTKPKVAGFGVNWQHCRNVLFVGVDDSWEKRYQAIKRCHRFGQTQQVNVHTVFSSAEHPVIDNLRRKQEQAERMGDRMIAVIKNHTASAEKRSTEYKPTQEMEIPSWLES